MAPVAFTDLHTEVGLKKLNGFLTARSYLEGYSFSDADVQAFKSIPQIPDAKSTPHAYRWYIHIAALLGLTVALSKKSTAAAPVSPKKAAPASPKKAAPASPKKAPAAEKDDDDDVDDLFGDDDEDDEAAAEAAKKAAAARAQAAKSKTQKAKPVERSQCVFEVKPWEAETDLEALATKIKAISIEGLKWGEGHKIAPIAYGINKLIVSCVIIDDLVGIYDIEDAISAFEEEVQSVEHTSMNKI